ncbi:MAG: TonB-dependent receptor [Bacteroidota bacterium]
MKAFLPILLILLILPSTLWAQLGTIQGRVTDAETGDPLTGASIVLIGTYKGAYTDGKGNFRIEGIKAGDYSVKFSYIGYADKIFNGISVSRSDVTTLNAPMTSAVKTLGEVEIVGKKALIDLESGQSSVELGQEDLAEISATNIQQVAALTVGVSENPDGIQIRGGRVYETEYVVEGISAQDPLAGTGFGVDVSANAASSVKVTTGGASVEYGNGSSGVVATRIREGSDKINVNIQYKRDNLGTNVNQGASWNTDDASISIGGPIIKNKLTYFLSGSMFISDTYYRVQADQLYASLFTNDSMWAPRQDNRWANTAKLTFRPRPGLKISLTNVHSLNINQSTRTLQVAGNDAIVQPGFQYNFSLLPNNANTYTHQSNLSVLNVVSILNEQWSMDVTVGRLFTNLRVDANGRPYRTETVDQIFDPASIVTDPVTVFEPDNTIDSVLFVFPGPGLVNNGGLATRWHDHYTQEYTFKPKLTYKSRNKIHYMQMGLEHKEQEFQWIEISRPWVGAPIQINDTLTSPATRLGASADVWSVRPALGGLFFSDEIEYKGIIANLGLRFNYWAPGKFIDDVVADSNSLVLDAIRQDYMNETVRLFGKRWKARLLPRIRVSFPVTENNVLYFNYSHAMRMPQARFVYQGLDPVYQDRSFLSFLGNPNIDPEVTVSYEVGLKSQLSKDWALTATAFYNDKFDYIVSRRIEIRDQTGRFVSKRFFINQDYARIRGLEVALTRRIGDWFTGTLSGAYQIATGQSNSAAESGLQIVQQGFVNTTKEQFLAWDRPFDFKLLMIFKPDETVELFGLPLKGFRAVITSTYKSGLRYTPFTLERINPETGRPEYEPIQNQPFASVGSPWFWADFKLSRDLFIGRTGRLSLTFEVKNFTNYRSAAIVNPVTGRAYEEGDPLPLSFRDPLYPDPQNNGAPPFNPARFTAPRQIWFGAQVQF